MSQQIPHVDEHVVAATGAEQRAKVDARGAGAVGARRATLAPLPPHEGELGGKHVQPCRLACDEVCYIRTPRRELEHGRQNLGMQARHNTNEMVSITN